MPIPKASAVVLFESLRALSHVKHVYYTSATLKPAPNITSPGISVSQRGVFVSSASHYATHRRTPFLIAFCVITECMKPPSAPQHIHHPGTS